MDNKNFDITGYEVIRGAQVYLSVKMPTECPLCKRSYFGQPLSTWSDQRWVSSLYYCNGCSNFFISGGYLDQDSYIQETIQSHPQLFTPSKFNNAIEDLSPNFVNIYSEAKQAEESQLTSICGPGYRKSLEFLVKDYAISSSPDEETEIKSSSLMSVINDFIKHEEIKVLARKSAWIGNDETHYVRMHENLDYQDLKEFINAIIGYITAELSVRKAEGIISKK